LLQDAGIIRHRGKIEATINNANRALEVIDEFGSLDAYLWSWEPAEREPDLVDPTFAVPNQTATSKALSKELKKRGWRFVGPTTVYAFMQAMGLVDDHDPHCEWRRT
jgi:DNA-3-methyladenine glycosylase I